MTSIYQNTIDMLVMIWPPNKNKLLTHSLYSLYSLTSLIFTSLTLTELTTQSLNSLTHSFLIVITLTFVSCNNNGGGNGGGQYICTNGTLQSEFEWQPPSGNSNVERCSSCNSGYFMDGNSCTNLFGLLSNGVTIHCRGLNIGDTFNINGTMYTKRTRAQINTN